MSVYLDDNTQAMLCIKSLLDANQVDLALTAVSEFGCREGLDFLAYAFIASVYTKHGKHLEAIQYDAILLSLEPNSPFALRSLQHNLTELGNVGAANNLDAIIRKNLN